jgi:hypothetical protein
VDITFIGQPSSARHSFAFDLHQRTKYGFGF